MRRILVAVSSLGPGGAERAAVNLCNAWAARGDAVTLLATFSGRGECFYPLSDAVTLVYLCDLVGPGKRMWRGATRLWSARRFVRERRPEVVISFLTNVNVAMIIATAGLGVPVVVCERTNPQKYELPLVLRVLRQALYRWAALVTVQTDQLAKSLGTSWCNAKRLTVLPNPISPDLLADSGTLPRKHPTRRRLLAMGRLSSEKQFGMLIELFHSLHGTFPEWDLWIVGDGPLKAELVRQVAALGLEQRAHLPGKTRDPGSMYLQADAFVLTSSYEGFPNVLLEAMAFGIPCVSFDCPYGPREITHAGQDALLVPAGDTAGLAAALQQVMRDDSLRRTLGTRASASVRERFSLAATLNRWDAVFDEVVKRNDEPPPGHAPTDPLPRMSKS